MGNKTQEAIREEKMRILRADVARLLFNEVHVEHYGACKLIDDVPSNKNWYEARAYESDWSATGAALDEMRKKGWLFMLAQLSSTRARCEFKHSEFCIYGCEDDLDLKVAICYAIVEALNWKALEERRQFRGNEHKS